MAVDTVSSTAASGPTSALGRQRLAENFDTFLSLLTTQLKNQDPLSPLDSNQFTQQIVQMTGVEQQLLTNDLLEKLVTNTSEGVAAAVSLIGKEVRAATTDARLTGGKAEWVYNQVTAADDIKVDILDSAGKVVRSFVPADKKAGDHTVAWDGKDQFGQKLPDGLYSLRVAARTSEGKTVPASIYVQGLVTGVEQADGKTFISVNGAKVPWDYVTQIKQPAAQAGVPETPGDTTSSPAAA